MSQLGEGDLGHQKRLYPGDAARLRTAWRLFERRRVDRQWLERVVQLFQRGFAEASADLAGVDELALLAGTQEQRAKMAATASRLGEADDVEFLTLLALYFEPVARAPRAIG